MRPEGPKNVFLRPPSPPPLSEGLDPRLGRSAFLLGTDLPMSGVRMLCRYLFSPLGTFSPSLGISPVPRALTARGSSILHLFPSVVNRLRIRKNAEKKIIPGHPRCNIFYSFYLSQGLLSGFGSLLKMFCCLCFTSAVSNKLYYNGDEPNAGEYGQVVRTLDL